MTDKAKREGPLKVPLPFDEAIRRAVQVKPPAEGWRTSERTSERTKVLSPRKQAKGKPTRTK